MNVENVDAGYMVIRATDVQKSRKLCMDWCDLNISDGTICVGKDCESLHWLTIWWPVIEKYVFHSMKTAAIGDDSIMWVLYTQPYELCDETLMQAGIAVIDWKRGHVWLPSWVSGRITGAVRLGRGGGVCFCYTEDG